MLRQTCSFTDTIIYIPRYGLELSTPCINARVQLRPPFASWWFSLERGVLATVAIWPQRSWGYFLNNMRRIVFPSLLQTPEIGNNPFGVLPQLRWREKATSSFDACCGGGAPCNFGGCSLKGVQFCPTQSLILDGKKSAFHSRRTIAWPNWKIMMQHKNGIPINWG